MVESHIKNFIKRIVEEVVNTPEEPLSVDKITHIHQENITRISYTKITIGMFRFCIEVEKTTMTKKYGLKKFQFI